MLDCDSSNNRTVKQPHTCEMDEGPLAFLKFDALLGKLLAVPHEEIQRREREYQAQSRRNPKRRGPKPKTSVRASGD